MVLMFGAGVDMLEPPNIELTFGFGIENGLTLDCGANENGLGDVPPCPPKLNELAEGILSDLPKAENASLSDGTVGMVIIYKLISRLGFGWSRSTP